jgi:hypothetical protein
MVCSCGMSTEICAEQRNFGSYRPRKLHERRFEIHEASDRRSATVGILRSVE